jgi:protein-disulfide isomerase
MKNNKTFLLVVLAVGGSIFLGLALFSKNQSAHVTEGAKKLDLAIFVKPHSPVKGLADAKVTVVEFFDPECEACRAMHPIMAALISEYGGKVRFVMRYMPFHSSSRYAISALEEARELGKFDDALDVLFERQPEWGDHSNPRPELIAVYLEKLGIKKSLLDEAYLIPKHKWKIDLDQADGIQLGIRVTPTFFVNGQPLAEIGYDPIKSAIEDALASSK